MIERLAPVEASLRTTLFDRFLGRFPHRRAAFLALDATARRMTDETLQLLHGLAAGADWIWPHVADLVDLHRAYGNLGADEYDAFIDQLVDTAAELAAAHPAERAALGRQAAVLKQLVARAAAEWQAALPR